MVDTYQLNDKLSKFEPWQRRVLMLYTGGLELTTDCSLGCRDCGAGTRPAQSPLPREGLSLAGDLYEKLLDLYGDILRSHPLSLFGFNEPFDYHSQGKNFRNAYDLLGHTEKVKTGVPIGHEEEVLASLDIIEEIGIHDGNRKRLQPLIDIIKKDYPEYADVLKYQKRLPFSPKNDNDLAGFGIGCNHGVILTPTEIYSVRTVRPSKEHPYGFDKKIVSPDNFNLAALCLSPILVENSARDFKQVFDQVERWLDDGYYEIDSRDKVILPPLSSYIVHRFTFPIYLGNPKTSEKALGNLKQTREMALEFSQEQGLNAFEKLLLAEIDELIEDSI